MSTFKHKGVASWNPTGSAGSAAKYSGKCGHKEVIREQTPLFGEVSWVTARREINEAFAKLQARRPGIYT